jgi:enoyl-CoA hydratase/carnithine racemase
MSSPAILLAFEESRATVTLARPKLNPIDDNLLEHLDEALREIETRPEVIVVRIRSQQKAFSAGADLVMVQSRLQSDRGARQMMETARRFHRVYDRLAALPAVTVAEISGHALGGGLELALACDIRLAAHEAKLGLPETRVGLLPGAGGTQRLTELCGAGVASWLILACELIGGAEAERIGLVQRSCPAAGLEAMTDALVSTIAGLSGPALRQAKQCIRQAASISRAGAQAEIEGIEVLMKTEEARQRISAFLGG